MRPFTQRSALHSTAFVAKLKCPTKGDRPPWRGGARGRKSGVVKWVTAFHGQRRVERCPTEAEAFFCKFKS